MAEPGHAAAAAQVSNMGASCCRLRVRPTSSRPARPGPVQGRRAVEGLAYHCHDLSTFLDQPQPQPPAPRPHIICDFHMISETVSFVPSRKQYGPPLRRRRGTCCSRSSRLCLRHATRIITVPFAGRAHPVGSHVRARAVWSSCATFPTCRAWRARSQGPAPGTKALGEDDFVLLAQGGVGPSRGLNREDRGPGQGRGGAGDAIGVHRPVSGGGLPPGQALRRRPACSSASTPSRARRSSPPPRRRRHLHCQGPVPRLRLACPTSCSYPRDSSPDPGRRLPGEIAKIVDATRFALFGSIEQAPSPWPSAAWPRIRSCASGASRTCQPPCRLTRPTWNGSSW